MSDSQSSETPERRTRKVPIHERSVRVGDVIVVNGQNIKRNQFKERFAEGGYQGT
ncbi:MAG TPA: hypothetical protein VFA41_15625 [Ktedonobacteraceae bacterium]|jgi:hypothetical protein|nr:hypothetical protein [Ktedonobacteraceae bacterium]